MAEADAEDRSARRKAADEIEADAGLVRRTRARRKDDGLGREVRDLVEGDLVVAVDDRIGPQLAQEVDEVVSVLPTGSFPRKRESPFAVLALKIEIPAFAGMTPNRRGEWRSLTDARFAGVA
jgi:hypothetical protein